MLFIYSLPSSTLEASCSSTLPTKYASKPDTTPRSHRTRSLNNYTDLNFTFQWRKDKAAANAGKEMPAIAEKEEKSKEDRVDKEMPAITEKKVGKSKEDHVEVEKEGRCGSGQPDTETDINR